MNRSRESKQTAAAMGLALFGAAAVLAGGAGNDGFDLSWSIVSAGGGTSSDPNASPGSGWELDGTIAQANAGEQSGGGWELAGGFIPGLEIDQNCIVDLDYPGLFAASRCITFEFSRCGDPVPRVLTQMVAFQSGQAVGLNLVLPPDDGQGRYECLTIRDSLHTLRRTIQLVNNADNYFASVTETEGLIAGNLNNDHVIDILDFGIFVGQYASARPPSDCGTVGPHADIDGDGVVFLGDYTFLSLNFLMVSDGQCCSFAPMTDQPVTSISVAELRELGMDSAAAGDLNEDGMLDEADMAAFLLELQH